VLRLIFRLVRYAFLALLGGALAAKFLLQSRAEPDTEELDMVAVFEGVDLVSRAETFYGGKILGMFSGVSLDLRKVQPAPTGIHLDLTLICSGVRIVVPEGWRVRSATNLVMGGLSDLTATTADPDATTLSISGTVAMSGVQVVSKPMIEVVQG
jgi:hypothetical protein